MPDHATRVSGRRGGRLAFRTSPTTTLPTALRAPFATAVLVARAWGAGSVVMVTLASVIAWRLVPGRPLEVPGRSGVRWVVWPLLPVLVTLATPAAVIRRDLERASPIPRPAPGAAFLAMVSVASAASVWASSGFDAAIVVRNTLLLQGVAFIASAAFGASLSWVPGFVGGMVMWMVGTGVGWVAPWAILFRPASDHTAWKVSIAAAAAGVAIHLIRSARR